MSKKVKWSLLRASLGEGALCGACALFLASAGFGELLAQDATTKNVRERLEERQKAAAETLDQREGIQRTEKLLVAQEKFDASMKSLEMEDFGQADDDLESAQRNLQDAMKYADEAGKTAGQVEELQAKIRKAQYKLNSEWAESLVETAKLEAQSDKIDDALQKLAQASKYANDEAEKKRLHDQLVQLREFKGVFEQRKAA